MKKTKKKYYGNIGAGILALAKDTKKFLVCQRSKRVGSPGTYAMVGGAINIKESPQEGAKREFFEETMFNGNMDLKLVYIFKNPNYAYYNFIGIVDQEFTPRLNHESSGYEWLSYEELIKLNNKHLGLVALLDNANDAILDILNKLG